VCKKIYLETHIETESLLCEQPGFSYDPIIIGVATKLDNMTLAYSRLQFCDNAVLIVC